MVAVSKCSFSDPHYLLNQLWDSYLQNAFQSTTLKNYKYKLRTCLSWSYLTISDPSSAPFCQESSEHNCACILPAQALKYSQPHYIILCCAFILNLSLLLLICVDYMTYLLVMWLSMTFYLGFKNESHQHYLLLYFCCSVSAVLFYSEK